MSRQKSEFPLKSDEILTAEFQYIAASAFQANEDRSKAASFFLVSVGSLIAAIFGAQELSTATEAPSPCISYWQACSLYSACLAV